MAFTTREYTRLVGNECDDVTIKPNTEFKAFEGDYTVTCYALIKDTESDEVIILKPGDKIKGVGNVLMSKINEIYDDEVKEAYKKPIEKLAKTVAKRKPRKRKVSDD